MLKFFAMENWIFNLLLGLKVDEKKRFSLRGKI